MKDMKLFLVEGDKIIHSTSDLVDRVHLNVNGTRKLPDGLYNLIND